MQHVAAADGVAVDHGDDRLGKPPDLHLHVEHIQSGHAVAADISATPLDVHVAARTESLVAGTGKNDHANVETVAAIGESLLHFHDCKRCESIAVTWPVDGDFGNVMIRFKQDFLEVESCYGFPVSFHILIF